MLKHIYTHVRSPLGIAAIAFAAFVALLSVSNTPLQKAQVVSDDNATECPDGEQCCWYFDTNSCVRAVYPFSPFTSYQQYCQIHAGEGNAVYNTYNACAQANGGGTTTTTTCGDGKPDPSKECEDGNTNNNDGCSSTCTIEKCGDGTKQSNEECEDSNTNDNDGCSHDCKKEYCGDGIQQTNEECEDGNTNNNDGCSSTCKIEKCGDGIVQKPGADHILGTPDDEQCDDKNDNPNDSCTNFCKEARCGDGIVEEGIEECDDANGDPTDSCVNDESNKCKNARCGDGHVQPSNNEECDEGEDNGTADSTCDSTCHDVVAQEDTGTTTGGNTDGTSGTNSSSKSENKSEDNEDTKPEVTPVSNPLTLPEAPKSPTGNNTEDTKKDEPTQSEQPKTNTEDSNKGQSGSGEKKVDSFQLLKDKLEAQSKQQAAQQQEDTGSGSEQQVQNEDEKTPEEGQLHCLDADGNVSTDRSKCDNSKVEEFRQSITEVSDEAAKQEIQRAILGDNVQEQKNSALLESIASAKNRLQVLIDTQSFADDINQYFADSITWLDRGTAYFTAEQRPIEEVNQMAASVRQLVVQIATLVKQEKKLPEEPVPIDPIITKTEHLILKFREAIIALADAGVMSDAETIQHYSDAAEKFVAVREDCMTNKDQCGKLNDVLELLKLIQEPVMKNLNDHPDVLKKVEAKFAE